MFSGMPSPDTTSSYSRPMKLLWKSDSNPIVFQYLYQLYQGSATLHRRSVHSVNSNTDLSECNGQIVLLFVPKIKHTEVSVSFWASVALSFALIHRAGGSNLPNTLLMAPSFSASASLKLGAPHRCTARMAEALVSHHWPCTKTPNSD